VLIGSDFRRIKNLIVMAKAERKTTGENHTFT
jgi:hypothetical protein